MTSNDLKRIKRALESQHGGTAVFVQSVPVNEWIPGVWVRENVVRVFDLIGHPEASRAYAWLSPIEGTKRDRVFAMLHRGEIRSPLDAVRAVAVTMLWTRR